MLSIEGKACYERETIRVHWSKQTSLRAERNPKGGAMHGLRWREYLYPFQSSLIISIPMHLFSWGWSHHFAYAAKGHVSRWGHLLQLVVLSHLGDGTRDRKSPWLCLDY